MSFANGMRQGYSSRRITIVLIRTEADTRGIGVPVESGRVNPMISDLPVELPESNPSPARYVWINFRL